MSEPEGPVFQELVPQDVRDYWVHEAHNFTPWLADSIRNEDASHLEDVLGLDVEIVETEKSVGRYNLDILAEVVDDGRQVVIENQLDQSDHDHLGKAIAYAAGVNADIIVWIAPTFNDEHQDAIQWLNQNSREGVDLFAIRLEVWRIGDSQPAIRLNPVEKPSEWKRKAQRSGGEITETKELQEEFWTQFRDRIDDSSTILRPRKPKPIHYYGNPIGKSGFHISFVVLSQENELRLDLNIEDDEEAFWELKSEEEAIEQELGREVEWGEPRETRTGKMRSNLSIARDGDLENREKWGEYFDWYIEYGERFHNVFHNRIQQF
ncbi:DUF4268 domain-containing protein [Halococcus saccharolyticus]|uniref:DUF4268 domain-containing protein n=1 Tax=Halococcus saccharolyticus DSM 5350 TaxID=1227455 RepID=M0MFB5_9EURY|nr:DUF4268 domain-containing protein [Halococcus saccharolyticus]EMA43110.1 hypothetical protein C449_14067 [Halococcus saccharolyticus DSM 5350]